MNASYWFLFIAVMVSVWERHESNKEHEAQRRALVKPTPPGLYKARFASNTIIEVFDEYNHEGNVRISLKEGGALSETTDGVACMGLMADEQGKKRHLPREQIDRYFVFLKMANL